MYFRTALPIFLICSLANAYGQIVAFGEKGVEVEFVFVGDIGNSPDEPDFRGDRWGAVSYPYRIGKYELSCKDISADSQCANEDGPPTRMGLSEALEFANLLNEDHGLPPAYQFDTSGQGRILKPWVPTDLGYDPINPMRNSQARFFLPTADEWYKAAYYDPDSESYFDYATGTNDLQFVSENTVEERVFVFGFSAFTMQAGGLSPYGTMGQSGNVGEWHEPTLEPALGGGWTGIGAALSDQTAFRSHQVPGTLNVGLRMVDLLVDIRGDFDIDGLLSAADIDLLSEQVRTFSEDLAFDVNSDGLLDSLDRTEWVEEISRTNFGDADLNGDVSFRDFLALANNFDQPSGWAEGDFDGNGLTDFQDFRVLASNFGAHPTQQVSAVPEPSSPLPLFITFFAFMTCRRKRTE